MKKNYFPKLHFFLIPIFCFIGFLCTTSITAQYNFVQSELDFDGHGNILTVTSLEFGPDGKLYVAEYPGTIKVLTIVRVASDKYKVTDVEVINGLHDIQNHNDDGSLHSSNLRETTGLTVVGTAANPIIYVTSSDFRIGGGSNNDSGLDTNSGTITRFTKSGTTWSAVDIVRGLPRSEENHASNGLEFVKIQGKDYLLVAQGGHTNGGSPSKNFNYLTEYALSGAILAVDLTALNSMPVLNDNGRNYIYDIPTLDDPSRPNVNEITDPDNPAYNGIDVGDPFGGNDGLNQAMIVPGGPVQIFSPGYRNAYDLVVTQSGAVYVTDNGANGGWGGFPENEGMSGTVTNNYVSGEPGSNGPTPDGELINNKDHLTLVTNNIQNYTFGSFYGGHPNPVRANPGGAGLFSSPNPANLTGSVFRTMIYDPDGSTPGSTNDPTLGLPANWPPVPLAMADSREGDWRGPGESNPDGPNDELVTVWGTNTNGLAEYTSANAFGGDLQGDLLAGNNHKILRRVSLKPDGSLDELQDIFASNFNDNALGVASNGDEQIFPGTVWIGIFHGDGGGSTTPSTITVMEPADIINCIDPTDPLYDPLADYDNDGYTNQDEEDNGSDSCNGAIQPNDFDKSAGQPLVSDLNDDDDDNDGILDKDDPFQLGNPNTTGSDAFTIPVVNELFSSTSLGGYQGLGMTGLMNNGDSGANWLDWLDVVDAGPNPNDIVGGAIGAMTMQMTSGTALGSTNTQHKGFQYGVRVDQTMAPFTVVGNMINFDASLQLYGNTNAPNGELGIFIGDGTQSNYIKFVLTKDGFTALQEINDIPQTPVLLPIPVANRPVGKVSFYIVVDPSNGNITLEYDFDEGVIQPVGTLTAQGALLTSIQQSGTDLAVGLIGTSNASGVELEGTWEYLNVLSSNPIVSAELPNITRLANTADEDIDLTNYFNDDQGATQLTYTVANNTDPNVAATISGTILTLSYPGTPTSSDITIKATDANGNFVEQEFTVYVIKAGEVLYRVNAGGPEIAAIDGGMAWAADTNANNSPYLLENGSNSSGTYGMNSYTSDVNQTTTPVSIFDTERYDTMAGEPEMTYSFPVTEEGNYEIRLYMGNGWSGTSQPGTRIFDVQINDVVYPKLNELDLSATYGSQVGTMISHIVHATVGSIDIKFLHGAFENPLVNGIEILDAPGPDTPIYANPLLDQNNNAGEHLDGSLIVSATGGDGNLNYTASGLPPGLTIEPTNGQIGGILDFNADANSPYNVSITVDDYDSHSTDAVTINFVWTIGPLSSYRINAGGPTVIAVDGKSDWQENTVEGAHNGAGYTVNTGDIYAGNLQYADRHASIPTYINEATFNAIFKQERYDLPAAPEMEFSIPLANGTYMVNLFMGNSFPTTDQPGKRLYDILVEGNVVKSDFDPVSQFGPSAGGMLAVPVTLTDGTLNISFAHNLENPLIDAIEILSWDGEPIPLDIYDIADQTNQVGQEVFLGTGTFGGEINGNVQYSISGQPTGLDIDPETGLISGTIDPSDATGSPNGNGTYPNVTVTAVQGGTTVQTTFKWVVTDFFSIRINTGGALVTATDGKSDWLANSTGGAVSNSNYSVNTGSIYNDNLQYADRDASIPGYIDEATYTALFAQQRYDLPAAPEMEFKIPIINGNYKVNLFFGNSFTGTNQPGARIFDVELEGMVQIDDFDPVAAFGDKAGGMVSRAVTVTDGELNIKFLHQIENPQIFAIEITSDDSEFPPVVVDPIADQFSQVGDGTNGLAVSAIGGDPNENFTYGISGQPDGIDIEPTNGHIFGTISAAAATGGPNGDGVYQVTVTVTKPGSSPQNADFTWVVGATWHDMNENTNYTARHECSFVQAGDKFYLMGGRENAQTLDIYDYASNTWNSLVDSAPVEFNHYQATEYQGLIWVIGALKDNDYPNEAPADYVWAFDPATQEWIQGPEIPAGRKRGGAGLVLRNDKFYIVGGNTNGHDGGYVAWFDEYDPATGVWTTLVDAPRPRDHFSAVLIGDKLYAAGGRTSGGPGGVFKPVIPEVDVFDFTTNTWNTLPAGQNIPTPRGGATAVNFNDKLVVIGGEVENEMVYGVEMTDALKITEQFDPATGLWSRLPDLNHERHGTQAIISGSGIFITGGSPAKGGGNQKNMEFYGINNPTGDPSVANNLLAPTDVEVLNGDTRDFDIQIDGGNVGIIVRSMALSGPNAADFSIDVGELTNALLKPGSTHTITVGLSGTGANRTAILTINYGGNSSIDINLTNNNIAPVVTDLDDQINMEGDSPSLQVTATDPENGILAYIATGLPTGLSIDQTTGTIAGTIASGASANSPYSVVVTVTDDGDPTGSDTTTFVWTVSEIVGNQPPVVADLDDQTNAEGDSPSLQIMATDPENGILAYIATGLPTGLSIDQTTGTIAGTIASGASANSPYSVVVTVTDDGDPMESGIIQFNWNVTDPGNEPPVGIASASPLSGPVPLPVTFIGDASTDDVEVIKYEWDFKDGTTSADPNPIHEFETPGTYEVVLTVTDGDGLTDTATVIITVMADTGNAAPIAVISATPEFGEAPLEVHFTGSDSSDDVGITTYSWNFKDGDGDTSNEADPIHTFTEPGTYEVTLTVTDGDGLTDTATITINVDPKPGDMEGIIYPNPASNIAKVLIRNLPSDRYVVRIYIHDITGRFITSMDAQASIKGGVFEIPVYNLTNGFYFVGLQFNEGKSMVFNLLVRK